MCYHHLLPLPVSLCKLINMDFTLEQGYLVGVLTDVMWAIYCLMVNCNKYKVRSVSVVNSQVSQFFSYAPLNASLMF